jgi:DNA polymerase I-like protein with 3'-5' exonuclease and polymerase domains
MRLVFDIESTTAQKGHPFNLDNRCCNMGFRDIETGEVHLYKIEYDEEPYGEALRSIQKLLDECNLLIGFNLKFDLHWLRRYGLVVKDNCRVFDCQVAWFILTHQKTIYPSLDGVAEHYGVEKKLDVVKTEYWERGLDTDQVPYDILSDYLAQDLLVTEQVYNKIQEDLHQQSFEMKRLISITMQDLVVLEDIEWNGLLYNKNKSIEKGNKLYEQIERIDTELRDIFGTPWLNPNSGDHLSAVLYGSVVQLDSVEDYEFVYKDGHTATKRRKIKTPSTCRGLFKPLEGSSLAKDGFYSTDVATLKELGERARGVQQVVIDKLLLRSKIEKQRSTYFHGLPNKIDEFSWKDNVIHSNFNQCVARNGRLSSSKPNVQNLEEEVKECFLTRF